MISAMAAYTFHVPLDVAAEVISNIHLSSDYNVLGTRRARIAERALPGQFVMVKAGDRLEPLLRRPFSVFEVLARERPHRRAVAPQQAHRPIDEAPVTTRSPAIAFSASDRSGGPFVPVAAPDEAWLVAGGVGLAPFATLAEALRARDTQVKLYYGARRAAELFYLDMFAKHGRRARADDRRRKPRRARTGHRLRSSAI